MLIGAGGNHRLAIQQPISSLLPIADPTLDYRPISETLEFTIGQAVGDSLCANISIRHDDYVEAAEMFEVNLHQVPEDSFKVLLVPEKEKAVVTIRDEDFGNLGI